MAEISVSEIAARKRSLKFSLSNRTIVAIRLPEHRRRKEIAIVLATQSV
ncbi:MULTISPECIES: hypothetical protein [unclassified Coleofasciculus]|nr:MULTISPECIES: hypothetical protein [unclassified Coleofasciculus]MBE9129578.1 hypothetical protein [Coleofasciculus sp. LEGE 07081]MBE9148258.1 hypothetical protein [Coleofasciculus sp. LEGE 07092]